MKYIVLIADTYSAKSQGKSPEIQNNLDLACAQLNRSRVALRLVSPFVINEAGAAQALFGSAHALWASIFELEFAMHPSKLCYGIGVGEVDGGNTSLKEGIEGQALSLAQQSIASLQAEAKRFRLLDSEAQDALVKHLLDLVSYLTKSWRKNRIGTFVGLLKQQPVAQIAEQLQITEQAVYRNIRDAELMTLLALFTEISSRVDSNLRN